MRRAAVVLLCAALAQGLSGAGRAQEIALPILVPLTGPIPLEGTSQRNGALLALRHASPGLTVTAPVTDTGGSPEQGVNALERALGGKPAAIVASMLGTQLLAMLPVAEEAKVPLLTISRPIRSPRRPMSATSSRSWGRSALPSSTRPPPMGRAAAPRSSRTSPSSG